MPNLSSANNHLNCLLLSRYGPLAASSRLRFYQYLDYLREHRIHVEIAPLLDDWYVENLYAGRRMEWMSLLKAYGRRLHQLRQLRNFDLIWIEAEALPWLPAWTEAWMLEKHGRYVVDYDDAAFHRYDLHSSHLMRKLMGQKIDHVMKKAALVITGNDYLAERARRAGASRIEILPTVVDLGRYFPAPRQVKREFVIGWIGSPVTAQYLCALHGVAKALRASIPTLLRTCGISPIHWQGVQSDAVEWSEGTEVQVIQTFDVGIMPLPDTPWTRGKCGYKLIQYMACGIPVVASPVGVNQRIVRNSENGFLAGSTDEWIRALSFLRDHPEARAAMGRVARKDVEAQYSLQVTAPRLASLLLEAASA